MANFNLPFGVFVSNENVLDVSRYVVKDISERDSLIPYRAYTGLQTYVKDNSTLYILKDSANSIWGIIPDASSIATSDASKLNNYTDTFYGDLTIDGSIVISGNIIQDGSYYVTNVEEITSKNEFITLRDDAITALNDGSISGIRINKADGSTNVILGAGNDAVMRVGWEGDALHAIATREDNPTNLGYAYWDDASAMFKTDAQVEIETVNRTIYVETTGSDETGDGLSVGTAFATITKAISTIKKQIAGGVDIIIKLGIGTFNMGLIDFNELGFILGDVKFEGIMTLVESGFTIGVAEVLDPYTFSISGGNSATWTVNQWQRYFVKSTTNYIPITHNTAGPTPTLSVAGATFENSIYEHSTIINCTFETGGSTEITGNKIIGLYFYYIKFQFPSCSVSITPEVGRFQAYSCTFPSISTANYFYLYPKSGIHRCIFYNWRIAGNRAPSAFISNYCYLNANSNVIQVWGDVDSSYVRSLRDVVLENPNTGAGANCLYFAGNKRYWGESSLSYLKFVNSNVAIRYVGEQNTVSLNRVGTSKIIIKNTNYFIRRGNARDDYQSLFLLFNLTDIVGVPIIRWFYDPVQGLVNLISGRNVKITGLVYPEVEQNLSSVLTNNSTTNIIIGDVSQNISCKVDYTIKRGSGFRSGNFNIISDVSNSYITPDIFGTNFDSAVDASAISFSTDISNGKYIMMNVTQNNSTDASLFYNVSRVMRTPIIM